MVKEIIKQAKEENVIDTKPYNDRFLEAMYITEGFCEHCNFVDKIGEWTEEFSEKFELVYEKTKEYASCSTQFLSKVSTTDTTFILSSNEFMGIMCLLLT